MRSESIGQRCVTVKTIAWKDKLGSVDGICMDDGSNLYYVDNSEQTVKVWSESGHLFWLNWYFAHVPHIASYICSWYCSDGIISSVQSFSEQTLLAHSADEGQTGI